MSNKIMINIRYDAPVLESLILEGHLFNKSVSLDKLISTRSDEYKKYYCENGCGVSGILHYSAKKYGCYFNPFSLYYPEYLSGVQIFNCNDLLINNILL